MCPSIVKPERPRRGCLGRAGSSDEIVDAKESFEEKLKTVEGVLSALKWEKALAKAELPAEGVMDELARGQLGGKRPSTCGECTQAWARLIN